MTTTKPDWANKLPEYQHWRHIPGKGWCATQRMMFTWGLFVGITEHLYSYRYCFEHEADAIKALETWDGNGDAPGPWIKRKGLDGEKLNPNFIRDAKAPVSEIRGEVTWCEDQQFDADVRYVRADRFERQAAELAALREENQALEDDMSIFEDEIVRKDRIIEQQAAELAALRGFAREAIENLRYGDDSVGTITDYAKEYNLIDEYGQQTALLTGESE